MKNYDCIKFMILILGVILLSSCAGTCVPAISDKMIIDDENFLFDSIDNSSKVNEVTEF